MRYIIFAILLLVNASSATTEQQSQETQNALEVENISVRLVEITERRALPDDLPRDARPYQTAGHDLVFMVEGSNLAKIKSSSLTLEAWRNVNGNDIRLIPSKDDYRQEAVYEGGCHIIYDEKYGFFRMTTNDGFFRGVAGLEVHGTITLFVADGTEILTSDLLDFTNAGETELGDFKINLEGEKESEPFPFPVVRVDGAQITPSPQANNYIAFSLEGALVESIARVDIFVGDERLNWISMSQTGPYAEYEYRKTGDGKGVLKITYWKNLREVVVPFSFQNPVPNE